MTQVPANDLVQCIACRLDIRRFASLCQHCHSFQSPWRNHLRFWGTIATLIVALGSIVLWAGSHWSDFRKVVWWRDIVRIVSLNSLNSVVIANNGDGEVYLSHLTFGMMDGPSPWIVNRPILQSSVAPGSFYRYEFKEGLSMGKVTFIRTPNDEEWATIRNEAGNQTGCYRYAFYTEDDPFLADLRAVSGSSGGLRTLNSRGYLHYFAVDTLKEISFGIVGVAIKLPNCS